jgi:hypothetical protein
MTVVRRRPATRARAWPRVIHGGDGGIRVRRWRLRRMARSQHGWFGREVLDNITMT